MPFIAVNCASIPKDLIVSELFGYVGGAFTGAHKEGRAGKIEMADKGTLFLDEIGDMPLSMQTVLLRAIEERSSTRLGCSKQHKFDVRIISATNKDLLSMVKEGKFRLDLYYRLNVIQLKLAPLRERLDDIPYFLHFFIRRFNYQLKQNVKGISQCALEKLMAYSWPGNVRQLRNFVESTINIIDSDYIGLEDLDEEINPRCGTQNLSGGRIAKLSEAYNEEEKLLIKTIMQKYKGNKSLVACELGIARTTLYRKLKLYSL